MKEEDVVLRMGLFGGMSGTASPSDYRLVNELVRDRLGEQSGDVRALTRYRR